MAKENGKKDSACTVERIEKNSLCLLFFQWMGHRDGLAKLLFFLCVYFYPKVRHNGLEFHINEMALLLYNATATNSRL